MMISNHNLKIAIIDGDEPGTFKVMLNMPDGNGGRRIMDVSDKPARAAAALAQFVAQLTTAAVLEEVEQKEGSRIEIPKPGTLGILGKLHE